VPAVIKQCKNCKKPFRCYEPDRRHCSRKCSDASRRLPVRNCGNCKKPFSPSKRGTKYCGMSCKAEASRRTLQQGKLRCPQCKRLRLTSCFPKNKSRVTGYSSECKSCKKRYWASLSSEEKDRRQARRSERAFVDVERRLIGAARMRARARKISFSLRAGDLPVPAACPVCATPMQSHHGAPQKNSPSIDRVDPKGPYSKENCWVICHRCNARKTDSSLSWFLAVALRMAERMSSSESLTRLLRQAQGYK